MGLDFDAIEYIKKLKTKQDEPPFVCPVEKCGKNYKSVVGLQYHLVNYDHDNPQPITPLITPSRKKGRSRVNGSTPKTSNEQKSMPKEAVVYCETEDIIHFHFPDGKSVKVSAVDPLPIISQNEYLELLDKNAAAPTPDIPPEPHLKLPEASFKEIENYNICDAPPRPNAYIRFIEKSVEELDGEVEYDVDEEDTTWLGMINEKREEQGMNPVGIDTLELLMDRLEKESYFQAAANGQSGALVDDDAICCICLDGECQNTNVILFCDMCNLAVHQDCYGVPYIPEGQWLCRKCLQSPSTPVNCVLCPNTGGAFKQTDRGHWAHVVCALWIPEVRFANTVFLEPIDSIEMIPPARWRLTCYVCKEKGIGACIQCQRNSCYAAFHVTCAQQAGLYMHMDTVKDHSNDSLNVTVQKSAYCHAHTPPEAKLRKDKDEEEPDTRHKMKKAREVLAKKRSTAPTILIPTIPPDRVQEISSLVTVQKKTQFISKLIAYWTLKRQYRNGVPLLRRLQSQGQNHGGFNRSNNDRNSSNASELYQQLKYWQCLRQDLERARLLCELVRKREKLKVAHTKIYEQVVMLQINPIESAMFKLMDLLVSKDTTQIFLEPVDTSEVPDYLDIVKTPMDLGTMRKKLNEGKYYSLDDMESDFDLMIKNCLAYNNKDTIFYRAGIRMRDQCGPLFKSVRSELTKQGLIDPQKTDDLIAQEIDNELKDVLKIYPPTENEVQKLLILVDQSQVIKNPNHRTRKIKQIRIEISKMRKAIMKSKMAARKAAKEKVVNGTESSQEEDIEGEGEVEGEAEAEEEPKNDVPAATPPCSPLKNTCNSASPSGVNRRTAVLFTRKAQAVSKRPEVAIKEESSCEAPPIILEKIKSPKRPGKKRLSNDKSRSSPSGNISLQNGISPKKSPHKDHHIEIMPDSFRVYRANVNREISDTEDSDISDQISGSPCSSCSGFGVSGSGSEFYTSSDDGGSCSETDEECEEEEDEDTSQSNDENDTMHSNRKNINTSSIIQNNNTETSNTNISEKSHHMDIEKPPLEPLQLVWAKCRGYPWYPALIIDPATPKGFVYNGVPLPAPPQDVLNLRKNYEEEVFLVLFFDVKRTWQWLPNNKLEILGIDKELDQSKVVESKKPQERKAVKKAYADALLYQSQVTDLEGQGPDPIM